MTDFVATAITQTKRLCPEYWVSTLAQRLPGGAGSVMTGTFGSPAELEAAIVTAEWTEYAPAPEAKLDGCRYFKAPLPGRLGLIDLTSVAGDTPVVLDDRKNTGTVSATITGIPGIPVAFTCLIIGAESDQNPELIVWTLHPGEPIRPSAVAAAPGMHGKQITAADAIDLGLSLAKVV